MYIIYIATNTINGRSYVGQSVASLGVREAMRAAAARRMAKVEA